VVGEGPAEGVVGLRDWNQLGVALGGLNSLLAEYFISAFQAFESKKWLLTFKTTGAKPGGEYQGRVKLADQPEEGKRKSPPQSYTSVARDVQHSRKVASKHNVGDKYHGIMRTASRRHTYRMRYGHCCWDLKNGLGCDNARDHRRYS